MIKAIYSSFPKDKPKDSSSLVLVASPSRRGRWSPTTCGNSWRSSWAAMLFAHVFGANHLFTLIFPAFVHQNKLKNHRKGKNQLEHTKRLSQTRSFLFPLRNHRKRAGKGNGTVLKILEQKQTWNPAAVQYGLFALSTALSLAALVPNGSHPLRRTIKVFWSFSISYFLPKSCLLQDMLLANLWLFWLQTPPTQVPALALPAVSAALKAWQHDGSSQSPQDTIYLYIYNQI